MAGHFLAFLLGGLGMHTNLRIMQDVNFYRSSTICQVFLHISWNMSRWIFSFYNSAAMKSRLCGLPVKLPRFMHPWKSINNKVIHRASSWNRQSRLVSGTRGERLLSTVISFCFVTSSHFRFIHPVFFESSVSLSAVSYGNSNFHKEQLDFCGIL